MEVPQEEGMEQSGLLCPKQPHRPTDSGWLAATSFEL